jgi:hypothetical protein
MLTVLKSPLPLVSFELNSLSTETITTVVTVGSDDFRCLSSMRIGISVSCDNRS